jgi:DNA (cytosine-5)-methyltransferase 1
MDTTNRLTHISLCYGYGGIDLGLQLALGVGSVRTIAICEIESPCIENALAKMEQGRVESAPIWTDLKSFPWEQFRGKVDILSGGYPCQPFSAAGNRLGHDDPRHLWPWIADGIRVCQPAMCFFENVEGHITLGLSTVISDLEELGYTVSWGIFSASEVGAPHQRKRVFILALANSFSGGIFGSRDKLGIFGKIRQRGSDIKADCHIGQWPARPGEPQYGWEEPRTVP